jgi:hypothetical protein
VQSGNPGSVRAGAPMSHLSKVHHAVVEVERHECASWSRVLVSAKCSACDLEFVSSFNLIASEGKFWHGLSAASGASKCPALVVTLRGCRSAIGKPLSFVEARRALGEAA